MENAGRPWFKSHRIPGTEKGDLAASSASRDDCGMVWSICCYRGFGSPSPITLSFERPPSESKECRARASGSAVICHMAQGLSHESESKKKRLDAPP